MEDDFMLFMFLTSGGFLLAIATWNLFIHVQRRRVEKSSRTTRNGSEGAQIRFYEGGEGSE